MNQAAPESASIAAGAISALGASTCCVLALMLVSVGVGGARVAQLRELERFYYVFVAIAIGAFGTPSTSSISGPRPARPRSPVLPRRSAAGSASRSGRPWSSPKHSYSSRSMVRVFWVSTLAAALAFAAHASESKHVVLDVPGMNCSLCPVSVKKALERVPGVLEAKADLATRSAEASFDPDRAGLKRSRGL